MPRTSGPTPSRIYVRRSSENCTDSQRSMSVLAAAARVLMSQAAKTKQPVANWREQRRGRARDSMATQNACKQQPAIVSIRSSHRRPLRRWQCCTKLTAARRRLTLKSSSKCAFTSSTSSGSVNCTRTQYQSTGAAPLPERCQQHQKVDSLRRRHATVPGPKAAPARL